MKLTGRLALLLMLILLPLPVAQAHAELVSSNPVIGAHLQALPSQIIVQFDGNLLTLGGAKTNVLVVKDSQGREIDAQNSRVTGSTLSVDLNPVTSTGEFTVSWRVVSSDGHPEEGSYQFSVGDFVSLSPTHTSVPTPKSHVQYRTRLILLVGFGLALGIWIRYERARRKLE